MGCTRQGCDPNFLNQCSGKYLHKPSKTKVKLAVEKNSLVFYQQKLFHTEKIHLSPLADNKSFGTSKDKGDLYFTFVKGQKDHVTPFFRTGWIWIYPHTVR